MHCHPAYTYRAFAACCDARRKRLMLLCLRTITRSKRLLHSRLIQDTPRANTLPATQRKFPSTMVAGLSDNCWSQTSQIPQYPALDRDLQTEVCVVGAGMAGLTTAYKLAVAGANVLHSLRDFSKLCRHDDLSSTCRQRSRGGPG